jgi:bifunctional non-homologous end joining protein LigD
MLVMTIRTTWRMCPAKRKTGRKARAAAEDRLEEYHRKRDFSRTREPAGGPVAADRGRLRFVIQKHAASSLHYDLRLELDGVMRSWAVPKGPSLNPAVKRLAMQVEDHPIEYNTFEGTIPRGEYGGGTVMLWDRGTFTPDERRGAESHEDAVRRGLRAGKLSFTFHGERLRGSFALVRTDGGEKPKWLLIKHRDADADPDSDITAEVVTSVDSGRTMEEIAAGAERVWRSNRGGGSGGEERAAPQEDEGEIAPMRPTPARTLPEGGAWTYEPWHGGERVLAYVTPDRTRLVTADSATRTRSRAIADQLSALARRVGRAFVLDGELVDGDDDAVFHVGDLLLDGDRVLLHERYARRRAALETLFARRRVKGVRVQVTDVDGFALMRSAERHGWAGVIARREDGTYTPGRRSDAVVRVAVR